MPRPRAVAASRNVVTPGRPAGAPAAPDQQRRASRQQRPERAQAARGRGALGGGGHAEAHRPGAQVARQLGELRRRHLRAEHQHATASGREHERRHVDAERARLARKRAQDHERTRGALVERQPQRPEQVAHTLGKEVLVADLEGALRPGLADGFAPLGRRTRPGTRAVRAAPTPRAAGGSASRRRTRAPRRADRRSASRSACAAAAARRRAEPSRATRAGRHPTPAPPRWRGVPPASACAIRRRRGTLRTG